MIYSMHCKWMILFPCADIFSKILEHNDQCSHRLKFWDSFGKKEVCHLVTSAHILMICTVVIMSLNIILNKIVQLPFLYSLSNVIKPFCEQSQSWLSVHNEGLYQSEIYSQKRRMSNVSYIHLFGAIRVVAGILLHRL